MHPILIQFGDFEIRWYGVMIALAFLSGTWLGVREAKRRGYDPELIYDLLFYVMIAGILGGRLYYVMVFNPGYFLTHPLEIFSVWRGGMAVHGGLIGGVLAGAWFCRRRGLAFWSFADLLTPSIMLGQAVGRGACSLNGCSYGKPTDLPWAVTFTDPASQAPHNVALHPTQFYELGTDFFLLAVLWNLRTRTRFDGQLFLIYIMLYAVARFFLEIFRGDSLMLGEHLRMAQVTSTLLLITAIALYIWRRAVTQSASPTPSAS
ncbi:MAG TPA: prolipoprotein diacylglyceryl transferase [Nitrospiria bacterium]